LRSRGLETLAVVSGAAFSRACCSVTHACASERLQPAPVQAAQISTRDAGPADAKLTGLIGRHRPQLLIQDVRGVGRDRPPIVTGLPS
jgi:hypothetical protein